MWAKKSRSIYDMENVDLFDELEKSFIKLREDILDNLLPMLYNIDPSFREDPNPIIKPKYPKVDRKIYLHKAGFPALKARLPYTNEEFKRLNDSKIGFAGCGGVQIAIMTLAREGVGNFVLVDHDKFEPSNLSRQAFCYTDYLTLRKTRVIEEFLKKINPQVSVTTYEERITTKKQLKRFFNDVDLLVDATGLPQSRHLIDEFRREKRIPTCVGLWGGWEGFYLTLFPDDPPFKEIFSFSICEQVGKKIQEGIRGYSCVGIYLMDTLMSRDIINYLLGYDDCMIRYPYILTVNLKRFMPLIIRDVRRIKRRYIKQ